MRHVVIDGNPWFVAIDACRCLGLNVAQRGAANYLNNLKPAEKWTLRKREALEHPQLNCGSIGMLFRKDCGHLTLISESGLYKLIMRSDKPHAATFQDWVTQEVLPSIRKTGSYGTQERLALAPPQKHETMARVPQAMARLALGWGLPWDGTGLYDIQDRLIDCRRRTGR